MKRKKSDRVTVLIMVFVLVFAVFIAFFYQGSSVGQPIKTALTPAASPAGVCACTCNPGEKIRFYTGCTEIGSQLTCKKPCTELCKQEPLNTVCYPKEFQY